MLTFSPRVPVLRAVCVRSLPDVYNGVTEDKSKHDMPCNAIICDWNGTLIQHRDERPVLEGIAVDLFWASFPLHPLRMLRIYRTRALLEALYLRASREAEFDFVRELFRVYNERIVNGVPVSLIHSIVVRYANREEVQRQLDHRVLRAIRACHRAGKTTGIFSAGYGYGILSILAAAGYISDFDFCKADQLAEENGRAVRFELNIYKNKRRFLEELLRERALDPRRVAYVGDSEDDEGCFELVGYPVMAYMAPEELKVRFARKYRAFVPKDEQHLANHLVHA